MAEYGADYAGAERYKVSVSERIAARGGLGQRNSSPNVEYLLARRELLDQAIERKVLEQERFGVNEDYEDGTILYWEMQFKPRGKTFTYVAIKCVGIWYTSVAVTASLKRLTWEQLIDNFLSKADYVAYADSMKEL